MSIRAYSFLRTICMAVFSSPFIVGCSFSQNESNLTDYFTIPNETTLVRLIGLPNNARSVIPVSQEMLKSTKSIDLTFPISEERITHLLGELRICKIIDKDLSGTPLNLRRGILFLNSKGEVISSFFIEKTFSVGKKARVFFNGVAWNISDSYGCISKNYWKESRGQTR